MVVIAETASALSNRLGASTPIPRPDVFRKTDANPSTSTTATPPAAKPSAPCLNGAASDSQGFTETVTFALDQQHWSPPPPSDVES
jgi:hypothetical protein